MTDLFDPVQLGKLVLKNRAAMAPMMAAASPGPSTTAIMGAAMGQGCASAIALALGVISGSLFWGVLAATGLSTVLAAWAPAIFAIKICGGLYLLWLA